VSTREGYSRQSSQEKLEKTLGATSPQAQENDLRNKGAPLPQNASSFVERIVSNVKTKKKNSNGKRREVSG